MINKRGQLAIFIIIAIIIAIVLIALFWSDIRFVISKAETPQTYLKGCLEDRVEKAVEVISARGGSVAPVLFYTYNGEPVEYLCYTNEYYDTCTMQQPMLKEHIEDEIRGYIESNVQECVREFEDNFIKRGYSVRIGSISSLVEISPENINVNINTPISLSKEDEFQNYKKVEMSFKSKLYDLIMISSSILNWEARFGDSSPEQFMVYYPNLKIEKLKQQDGTKIYILTDLLTQESFTFASRSLSWPAGYGVGEKHEA